MWSNYVFCVSWQKHIVLCVINSGWWDVKWCVRHCWLPLHVHCWRCSRRVCCVCSTCHSLVMAFQKLYPISSTSIISHSLTLYKLHSLCEIWNAWWGWERWQMLRNKLNIPHSCSWALCPIHGSVSVKGWFGKRGILCVCVLCVSFDSLPKHKQFYRICPS